MLSKEVGTLAFRVAECNAFRKLPVPEVLFANLYWIASSASANVFLIGKHQSERNAVFMSLLKRGIESRAQPRAIECSCQMITPSHVLQRFDLFLSSHTDAFSTPDAWALTSRN